VVRRVDVNGFISFKARRWRIGKPFRGLIVALRPTLNDGVYAVRFCAHDLGLADQNAKDFNLTNRSDRCCSNPPGPPLSNPKANPRGRQ